MSLKDLFTYLLRPTGVDRDIGVAGLSDKRPRVRLSHPTVFC